METIANSALALGVIASILLLVGGARMVRRDRKRGALMIGAALVIFGNVLIWTV